MSSEGLTIGIYVVAPSMKDELCIGLMRVIENIFKFYEVKWAKSILFFSLLYKMFSKY